ncbi:MAG: hypothetical protein NWE89_00875 [Candidatus Bathyarchaeota archaeon]|nr:hypothetical protein [Candidatus Bathyarchaeota archaeon]
MERLQNSIEWSNRQLEIPRQKRVESLKQFVGFHYNSEAAPKPVPTPFLKMAVTIYVRSLAARAPRAMISTKDPNLKSTANLLEMAVNEIPAEIKLQGTLRRLVMEALFSYGVAKCGLHTVGEFLGHKVGAPFIDVVTQDDFVLDMSATHLSQVQYMGDSYWLNYEDVMEDDWFEKKAKRGMKPDDFSVIGEHGEGRAEELSQSESASLFKEKVWLRDAWLPEEKLMLTYGIRNKKLLKAIEWGGPEYGPYHILSFDDVPGNLLPLPPVMLWRDLHELANSLFRKLGEEADSQKTVQGFPGNNDDAVEAFANARDGDGIRYQGGTPTILTAGGVNPNTLAFFIHCKDLISYFGGNLDSLGGLSPQAETLGQDKLISAASTAQLRDMGSQVIDFSRDLFRSLAHYEWHDPARRRILEMEIPGTDLSIPVPWDRQSRKGGYDMYDLDVDVFSLQDDSPAQKLQKLGVIMQQYVFPLMPAIEAAGGQLDVQSILDMVAKYSDFPELKELVVFANQQPNSFNTQDRKMPANTSRTVERVSRPGATESGKSAALQQTLLGGRQQPAEAAVIGRSTG